MRQNKLIMLLIMILPWLTIPLIGKKSIKRYLSAGIFISIIVTIESFIAKKRRWWWFHVKIHPNIQGEFPLIWGPFLIGSLWILKLTYRNFYRYIILNLIIDTFFTYAFVNFLQYKGIGTLGRLKKIQLSLLFFFKSLLLYGFQTVKETFIKG
ncbi:hypothetical protein ACTHO0_09455 [Cytobacillus praedii]|uniref:hypothetical protein n=1 Tax=Cytobacillus praedii TaxID=1742358 RepID=UPI002E1AB7CD|nr:hypothetical protein [Cytobacillus praedii]